MNPSGRWLATNGSHDKYIIEFERCGEAWSVFMDGINNTPPMQGVAFEHDGLLCVARGIVTQIADLDGSVGLVQYNLKNHGNLPARWYHSSLVGKLSEGLSANGPAKTIAGEYHADYEDANGNAFNPLRKTITKTNTYYVFAWWDEEKFHYVGIGKEVSGALFAAWGPPGSIIQFSCYDFRQTQDRIHGEWLDYGRNRRGLETLSRA